jgi:hypothetical protein
MVRVRSLTLIIVTAIAMISALSGPVRAAGLVLVNPTTTDVQSIGSFFIVQIKVAHIDPFNGWDIQVVADPAVVNATSLSTKGNTLEANYTATPEELANCVNGVGPKCTSSDGQGIVHSAMVFLGGQLPQQGPSNGLLFTINYTVVGSGTFSPLELQNVAFGNGGTSAVIVTAQDGQYGTAPGQNFALTPSTSSISLVQGSNSTVTLTVSSIGGFSGVVTLTNTSSTRGLSIYLNSTNIPLASGQHANIAVKVIAHNDTSAIRYTITVVAASGFLFHRSTISVVVATRADFILAATPSLLKIHATNSGSSTITLLTQSGFSGSIQLSIAKPPVSGLLALIGNETVTISPDRPAQTVFVVKTPDSSLPFVYLINITATSQSSSHTLTIVVKPPSPDFGFQLGGAGYVVQAGQSRSFTLTMTSVDYFKGQLFLLATSLSGAKEVFSRPSVALEFGNSTTSTLTITTDLGLEPGSYTITLTALGTTFLGDSVTHSINVTLTVTQAMLPTTILGIQPLAYFGVIGILSILVIGAAIKIRKPKPKRILS